MPLKLERGAARRRSMGYLDNHVRFETRDPDRARQVLADRFGYELGPPRDEAGLRMRVAAASFDELTLTHVGYGDIETRFAAARDLDDALMVLLPTAGAGRAEQPGREQTYDRETAFVRDMRHPLRAEQAGVALLALPLRLAALRAQAEAVLGSSVGVVPFAFGSGIDLAGRAGRQFRASLLFVAEQLNAMPAGPVPPLIAASWRDLLLTQALAAIPNSFQAGAARFAAPGALPYHVKRARDYIHANAGRRITLADLAAAAGCGFRTLQAGFSDAYGMAPMRYLKQVRLRAAHADLRDGAPGKSVGDVARRWGFTEMGRFAADYRHVFGCNPSETLRRAR